MNALYDVPAPAKLNLFLHVRGRRPDGYHLLQSVFMLVDWCDTLHFETRSTGQISREDLGLALPADDLTVRAARALQRASGTHLGAHIVVQKRIPAQAGMGGGSSDAATCLLALNRLWGLGLSTVELRQIGVTLGADVPFFIQGHNAWVEGVGEQITPITLPPARFVVVKPQEGLETARIFGDPGLQRNTETATMASFAANPYGFGRNDLQPVARMLCPSVSHTLEWLGAHGLSGRMTGSGSAVFARALHDLNLQEAPVSWKVRVCDNLDTHPLAGWARSDDL